MVEVADTLAGLEINSSEPSIDNTSSEANLNIESKPYYLVSFDDAFFDCIEDIEYPTIDTPKFYFDCISTIDPAPALSIHPVHPLLPLLICWSTLLSALPAIHYGFQCIHRIQSIHHCIHPYLPAFDTIPALSYAKGVKPSQLACLLTLSTHCASSYPHHFFGTLHLYFEMLQHHPDHSFALENIDAKDHAITHPSFGHILHVGSSCPASVLWVLEELNTLESSHHISFTPRSNAQCHYVL